VARRGYSTTVGKFAKIYHDRRKSEIRMLGERLRGELREARAAGRSDPSTPDHESVGRPG